MSTTTKMNADTEFQCTQIIKSCGHFFFRFFFLIQASQYANQQTACWLLNTSSKPCLAEVLYPKNYKYIFSTPFLAKRKYSLLRHFFFLKFERRGKEHNYVCLCLLTNNTAFPRSTECPPHYFLSLIIHVLLVEPLYIGKHTAVHWIGF